MPAAIVFAAAPLQPTARLHARLAELRDPFVVAADAGAATALVFGFRPDVVVGDFDSLATETRAELERSHVPIEAYPRDKDFTDGDLAIRRALKADPSELLLLGYLGGPRLDQALASVLLLTSLELPATLLDERNECRLVRPQAPFAWQPEPDEVVSLIPVAGDALGVTSAGLRWPLQQARLRLGETRGISNQPVGGAARVSVDDGLLLVTRHFAAL